LRKELLRKHKEKFNIDDVQMNTISLSISSTTFDSDSGSSTGNTKYFTKQMQLLEMMNTIKTLEEEKSLLEDKLKTVEGLPPTLSEAKKRLVEAKRILQEKNQLIEEKLKSQA